MLGVRTPFLDKVLEWKRENALKILQFPKSPAGMERKWEFLLNGLIAIAVEFFGLSEKPKTAWATEEFVAMSEAKLNAMLELDRYRVRWSANKVLGLKGWFEIWRMEQTASQLQNAAARKGRRDKRDHDLRVFAQLQEALRQRDWREAWRISRTLSGSGRGPRKKAVHRSCRARSDNRGMDDIPRHGGRHQFM